MGKKSVYEPSHFWILLNTSEARKGDLKLSYRLERNPLLQDKTCLKVHLCTLNWKKEMWKTTVLRYLPTQSCSINLSSWQWVYQTSSPLFPHLDQCFLILSWNYFYSEGCFLGFDATFPNTRSRGKYWTAQVFLRPSPRHVPPACKAACRGSWNDSFWDLAQGPVKPQHGLSRLKRFCLPLWSMCWMLSPKQNDRHSPPTLPRPDIWNGSISQNTEGKNICTNKTKIILAKGECFALLGTSITQENKIIPVMALPSLCFIVEPSFD